MYYEVHYTPKDSEGPVYLFVLKRRSPFKAEYDGKAGEKAYEAYEMELYHSFGGANNTTPIFLSVMIDAKTGELREPPIVECPSDRPSHYLDFILE